MKFLNNRDAKKILAAIEDHWGCDLSTVLKTNSFAITEKDKLYMFNRDIFTIEVKSTVKTVGMYIANLRDAQIRLSIEGAQLIAPYATKNVIDIADDQVAEWVSGLDIDLEHNRGFVIVRHNGDILGCGYAKEFALLNYVPKVRRINFA